MAVLYSNKQLEYPINSLKLCFMNITKHNIFSNYYFLVLFISLEQQKLEAIRPFSQSIISIHDPILYYLLHVHYCSRTRRNENILCWIWDLLQNSAHCIVSITTNRLLPVPLYVCPIILIIYFCFILFLLSRFETQHRDRHRLANTNMRYNSY